MANCVVMSMVENQLCISRIHWSLATGLEPYAKDFAVALREPPFSSLTAVLKEDFCKAADKRVAIEICCPFRPSSVARSPCRLAPYMSTGVQGLDEFPVLQSSAYSKHAMVLTGLSARYAIMSSPKTVPLTGEVGPNQGSSTLPEYIMLFIRNTKTVLALSRRKAGIGSKVRERVFALANAEACAWICVLFCEGV